MKPPPFERAVSAYPYSWPVDRLLQALKFRRQLVCAELLGELLAERLKESSVGRDATPALVVPIPLHRRRLRERGYNQALEIARPISRILGLELAPRLLRRVRHTRAQLGLDANSRRSNLKGAFRVAGDRTPERLALVDDVMTTGATLREAALALRRAGALEIEVWTVARAGYQAFSSSDSASS